jgi:hypothetical protein
VYWINLSVRAYICYEADEDQRHRLALNSVSRPVDSGVTRAALLPTSSLRSCQTKATCHTEVSKKSGRTALGPSVPTSTTPPSEMMRWQKMLYNMGAGKHSTNGIAPAVDVPAVSDSLSVACVAGPNVNRLRNPVFLSCFEFLLNSQWQKSLKILYFQHFRSKTYEINSARQDLSNNIEGTSQLLWKFSFWFNLFFNEKFFQYY